jgi:hypothetical protein
MKKKQTLATAVMMAPAIYGIVVAIIERFVA